MALGGAIVIEILNSPTLRATGPTILLSRLWFDDFAQKFLSDDIAVYFAKDFLVLVLCISFLTAIRGKELTSSRHQFLGPVPLFCVVRLTQVFNPASHDYLVRSYGVQNIFLLRPNRLFSGYALINSTALYRQYGSCSSYRFTSFRIIYSWKRMSIPRIPRKTSAS